MSALALAAGIGADHASKTRMQAELQRTADTAALAGVDALALSQGQPAPTRTGSAIAATESLIARTAPDAPRSITPSLKDLAVSVRLSGEHRPAFGGLFGKDASPITVTAVARYVAPSRPADPLGYDRDQVGAVGESGSGRSSAGRFGLDRPPRPEAEVRPQLARRGQPATIR